MPATGGGSTVPATWIWGSSTVLAVWYLDWLLHKQESWNLDWLLHKQLEDGLATTQAGRELESGSGPREHSST